MPNLSSDLLKQDQVYLIISCLIFPISLKIALFCFVCFLGLRILLFDARQLGYKSNKLTQLLKIVTAIAIAIAVTEFYEESQLQAYPVSYYDYLLIFITILAIKIYPLKLSEIQQICYAIAVSPLIVFIVYFPVLDFSLRNHWGFNNPNWSGLYCSICIPIVFCQILNYFNRENNQLVKHRKVALASLIILTLSLFACLIMMISSGSRSCFYTSSAIVMFILYLKARNYKQLLNKDQINPQIKIKSIVFTSSFLLVFSLLSKFWLIKFTFLTRFIDLGNSTNIYRIKIYQCYLQYGFKKFWWGWGFNRTATLCEKKLKARYAGVNHAHNFILQLFTDHGFLITLCCLSVLICFIIIPSLISILNSSFSVIDNLSLGINLASLSIIIVSLFQSAFYHYPLFPLWSGLLWGLQLTINYHKKTLLW